VNDTGSGTASDSAGATTKSVNPYLTRIENAATLFASSWTPAKGYYYTWGTSTQRDFARATFAAGQAISWVDLIPIEENLDGRDSAEANAYHNIVKMELHSAAKMATQSDNPKESYKAECAKMLEDAKMAFGNNMTTDAIGRAFFDEIVSIQYKSSSIKWADKVGDIFVPGELISKWEISYTQKRIAPNQSAI
jgi:DNA-binding helix-hairpin-helix protein with protein kinase domain